MATGVSLVETRAFDGLNRDEAYAANAIESMLVPGQLMYWALRPKKSIKEGKLSEIIARRSLIQHIFGEVERAGERVNDSWPAVAAAASAMVDAQAPLQLPSNPSVATKLEATLNQTYSTPDMGRHALAAYYPVSAPQMNFSEYCEQIYKCHDQRASLFLQERLRLAIPGEYEQISAAIRPHINCLMVHRFGNFLVQCMLELATEEDITSFAAVVSGRISRLSQHQFCCHVIQKILDVGTPAIQAKIAAELLEDALASMTSPFGTHVWQKLFHLPSSSNLPSMPMLANCAVHNQAKEEGWLALTRNDAGCATIKSFLSTSQDDASKKECVEELLVNFDRIMVQPQCCTVICKLATIGITRARTLTRVFSKAYEYCKHDVAHRTILKIFSLTIPSFATRFSAAVAPYRTELASNANGARVVAMLEQVQRGQ